MILSIYRAKHRRLPRMLGRYDIFEGLTGKKFCKGREPKGASLAVHSVCAHQERLGNEKSSIFAVKIDNKVELDRCSTGRDRKCSSR
jgi:hypothetical protein